MRAEIGKIISQEITFNRDRSVESLMLKVELSSELDVQTVEYFGGFGDNSIPPIGAEVVVLSVGSAWKIAVASRRSIKPDPGSAGDRILGSTNSTGTEIKAQIKLLANGDIAIIPSSGTLKVLGDIEITDGIIKGNNVFNGQDSDKIKSGVGTYAADPNTGVITGCSGVPGCVDP